LTYKFRESMDVVRQEDGIMEEQFMALVAKQVRLTFMIPRALGEDWIPLRTEVVASQPIHLLNNPIISALASVLKCKLKPTTAADVSAFTSSLSVFTAKTAKR
jgi:hypothetical protein